MTLRHSPALQNFIAQTGSWKGFLDNGSIKIYSGTQPATADLAVTGTLLATITSGAGTKTDEVAATGVITISGTTSGSVDTLALMGIDILGGAVTHTGSHTTTADAVVLKVNRNPANKLVVATNVLGVITLTARPGLGNELNAGTLSSTGTTCTVAVTSTTFGSGTGGSVEGVTAVNALKMDYDAADGVMTKDSTQTWSGTAGATGTAGWFRYLSSVVDAGSLDSSDVFLRMDGSIATSGSDLNMSSTAVTSGALQTLSTFSFTVPAA